MQRTASVLLAAVLLGLIVSCQQPQLSKIDRVVDCREAASRLARELTTTDAIQTGYENNYNAKDGGCYMWFWSIRPFGQIEFLYDVDRHKSLAGCVNSSGVTCSDQQGSTSTDIKKNDQFISLKTKLMNEK